MDDLLSLAIDGLKHHDATLAVLLVWWRVERLKKHLASQARRLKRLEKRCGIKETDSDEDITPLSSSVLT